MALEIDYKDLLSIELDEGVNIDMKEMSPKKNNLATFSQVHSSSKEDFEYDQGFEE